MTRLDPILEDEYARNIAEMARVFGWKCSHHPDSRRLVGDSGMPDITMLHPANGALLFVEIKRGRRKTTKQQDEWIDALLLGGHHVAVIYADDPADMRFLENLLRNLRQSDG